MCLIGPYLDGGSLYWSSPLGGVVLSLLHDVEMASDRIEVTAVPSVLAGSVRRACFCQCRHAWLDSISPRSSQGPGQWSGRESSCGMRLRQMEGS